jgi:hypothetical protein
LEIKANEPQQLNQIPYYLLSVFIQASTPDRPGNGIILMKDFSDAFVVVGCSMPKYFITRRLAVVLP